MKLNPLKFRFSALQCLLLSLLACGAIRATTLTWNDSAANTWNTNDTTIWGGNGPWNNATPDSAVFSGIGENISLSESITAASITFNSNGYVFDGSQLTLSGATPTIHTAGTTTAVINNVIAGSQSLTKTGAGILTLVGSSTFTGSLNINEGTLNLPTTYGNGTKSLSVAEINLAPGASLTCVSGAFGWYANNNAGGCTINIGEGASCQSNGAFGVAYTLKGGTINNGNGARLDLGACGGFSSSVETFASTSNSIINPGSVGLLLRPDSGQTLFPFTVANGDAIIDLDIQKPIIGDAGIIKNGLGLMSLSGAANTYSGPTVINGGTLLLGTSVSTIGSTSSVTIAPGATLDTSAVPAGYNIQTGRFLQAGDGDTTPDVIGNLSLASGTGEIRVRGAGHVGTLTVDGNLTLNGGLLPVDQSAGVLDKIRLNGAGRVLTLTGTNLIQSPLVAIPTGTYTLIENFASVSGTASNFAFEGIRGAAATFNVNATDVTMTITTAGTPGALVWSGTTNGVWDVNTTANWNGGTEKFYTLDEITFGDTATNTTVSINGMVFPSTIYFSNTSLAYTLRGGTNPVIAGSGALIKTGAGAVTLWHPSNTYAGGTSITGGGITLNNGATLASGTYTPLGTGVITINSGGSLNLNPGGAGANTYTFPNAVNFNGGMLYHQDCNVIFSGLTTVQAPSSLRTLYGGKNLTLAGGLAGTEALVVTDQSSLYGAGAVILGAAGTYSGQLTINNSGGQNGAVILTHPDALASARVAVNSTTADDAYGPNPAGLVLAGTPGNNYILSELSGTTIAGTVHNANDSGTRTLTINQSTDTIFTGNIGGTSGNRSRLNLVKSGLGALVLNGSDTYTGNTTVNSGTLVMKTRDAPNMDVTLADGTVLGLNFTGSKFSIDELNLGTTGACTVNIAGFSALPAPVIETRRLATNTTTTLNVSGSFSAGTYPLISYLTRTGSGTVILGPLPRGVAGHLEDSGTSINLVITGFNALVWKGTSGTVWDENNTQNWKLDSADPEVYRDGDVVLFDHTATSRDITLDSTVSPAGMTFSFDAPLTYSLTGSGAVSGSASLAKSGSGTLILSTANTYAGTTFVNGGTLVLGAAQALGSTNGGTSVSEATLDLKGNSIGAEPLILDNATLLNSSAIPTVSSGTILVNAEASLNTSSGDLSLGGAISGPGPLTKTGVGLSRLSHQSASYTGPVTVEEGTLRLDAGACLRMAPITVKTGATLEAGVVNALAGYTQHLVIESGGYLTASTGITSNIGSNSGSTTLQGGASLAGAVPDENYGSWTVNTPGGVINVAGGSPEPATITALNVTPAGTGGVLSLNVSDVTGSPDADLVVTGTFGSPYNKIHGLTLTGGGTVLINSTGSLNTGTTTVAANTTLGGTGKVNGPLTIQSDATLAPGAPAGDFSSGALDLKPGATFRTKINSSAGVSNSLVVNGDVTLGGNLSVNEIAASPITLPNGTSLTLITYTGSLTGTFTGLPEEASINVGANVFKIRYADDNAITLEAIGPDTFTAWAEVKDLDSTNRGLVQNPDDDELNNLLEFYLGGDPLTASCSELPKISSDATYLIFTFDRDDAAETFVLTQQIQYGSDLSGWTGVTIPAGDSTDANGVVITVAENGTAADTITVKIPKTLEGAGKLFARLKVTR